MNIHRNIPCPEVNLAINNQVSPLYLRKKLFNIFPSIGPRQMIGELSSTKKPMEITFTPNRSTGIIFFHEQQDALQCPSYPEH